MHVHEARCSRKRNDERLKLTDQTATNSVQLTTKAHLAVMVNAFRDRVTTLSVNFHEVLDFYTDITNLFMYWLLVT